MMARPTGPAGSYGPPLSANPLDEAVEDQGPPPAWALKLAQVLHLEWCASCNDWRDLGHSAAEDARHASQQAGQVQNRLEAETYPTIG